MIGVFGGVWGKISSIGSKGRGFVFLLDFLIVFGLAFSDFVMLIESNKPDKAPLFLFLG
jgi:hypothetical protein